MRLMLHISFLKLYVVIKHILITKIRDLLNQFTLVVFYLKNVEIGFQLNLKI